MFRVHRIHTPQVRFGYVCLTVCRFNYIISKPLVRGNDQLYEDDLLSSLGFQFLVDVQVCDEGMYHIRHVCNPLTKSGSDKASVLPF